MDPEEGWAIRVVWGRGLVHDLCRFSRKRVCMFFFFSVLFFGAPRYSSFSWTKFLSTEGCMVNQAFFYTHNVSKATRTVFVRFLPLGVFFFLCISSVSAKSRTPTANCIARAKPGWRLVNRCTAYLSHAFIKARMLPKICEYSIRWLTPTRIDKRENRFNKEKYYNFFNQLIWASKLFRRN